VEPVSEEVEDTSREDESTAHKALFPDTSEEDPDDKDSFTTLLAELNLEIEEEVDIELGGELEREGSGLCPTPVENDEAETFRMAKECDVRTDHPTLARMENVQPTIIFRASSSIVINLIPSSSTERHRRHSIGIIRRIRDRAPSASSSSPMLNQRHYCFKIV